MGADTGVVTAGRSSMTLTVATIPPDRPAASARSRTEVTSASWSTPGRVRTSSQTEASAGITFIWTGSPERSTVGVRWTSPRWRCVGCPAWSFASRSARSARKRATAGLGLRPWKGIAPWAITPRKSTRRRSAPFEVGQTSPSSGSQQIAASIPAARPLSTKCFTPAINPSSSTSAAMTSRPGNGPSSATAFAAKSAAASPPFMSALPRP